MKAIANYLAVQFAQRPNVLYEKCVEAYESPPSDPAKKAEIEAEIRLLCGPIKGKFSSIGLLSLGELEFVRNQCRLVAMNLGSYTGDELFLLANLGLPFFLSMLAQETTYWNRLSNGQRAYLCCLWSVDPIPSSDNALGVFSQKATYFGEIAGDDHRQQALAAWCQINQAGFGIFLAGDIKEDRLNFYHVLNELRADPVDNVAIFFTNQMGKVLFEIVKSQEVIKAAFMDILRLSLSALRAYPREIIPRKNGQEARDKAARGLVSFLAWNETYAIEVYNNPSIWIALALSKEDEIHHKAWLAKQHPALVKKFLSEHREQLIQRDDYFPDTRYADVLAEFVLAGDEQAQWVAQDESCALALARGSSEAVRKIIECRPNFFNTWLRTLFPGAESLWERLLRKFQAQFAGLFVRLHEVEYPEALGEHQKEIKRDIEIDGSDRQHDRLAAAVLACVPKERTTGDYLRTMLTEKDFLKTEQDLGANTFMVTFVPTDNSSPIFARFIGLCSHRQAQCIFDEVIGVDVLKNTFLSQDPFFIYVHFNVVQAMKKGIEFFSYISIHATSWDKFQCNLPVLERLTDRPFEVFLQAVAEAPDAIAVFSRLISTSITNLSLYMKSSETLIQGSLLNQANVVEVRSFVVKSLSAEVRRLDKSAQRLSDLYARLEVSAEKVSSFQREEFTQRSVVLKRELDRHRAMLEQCNKDYFAQKGTLELCLSCCRELAAKLRLGKLLTKAEVKADEFIDLFQEYSEAARVYLTYLSDVDDKNTLNESLLSDSFLKVLALCLKKAAARQYRFKKYRDQETEDAQTAELVGIETLDSLVGELSQLKLIIKDFGSFVKLLHQAIENIHNPAQAFVELPRSQFFLYNLLLNLADDDLCELVDHPTYSPQEKKTICTQVFAAIRRLSPQEQAVFFKDHGKIEEKYKQDGNEVKVSSVMFGGDKGPEKAQQEPAGDHKKVRFPDETGIIQATFTR